MKTLIVALAATCLTAEAVAGTAKLPRPYLGDWCLEARVENGYDTFAGRYSTPTMIYKRGSADCGGRIRLRASAIVRATKLQDGSGYDVAYRLGGQIRQRSFFLDQDGGLIIDE
jgi:hypothetical protein